MHMDLGRYLEVNHVKIEDFAKEIGSSEVMIRKVLAKERRFSDDVKLAVLKATRGQVTLDDLVVESSELKQRASNE